MARTMEETYEIISRIDADRRRAETGMWLSLAKMQRREQFWYGVGVVIAGLLTMLANREGKS